MDILSSFSNLLTGGLAGGITGIIGSATSAFANYKMKKLEYEQEVKMKKLEMDAMKVQIEVAKAKVEGMINLAEQETLKESYKSLNKAYFKSSYFDSLPNWSKPLIAILFAFLDVIRGIVRPSITIYILALITWVGHTTYKSNPTAFATSASLLVEIILYLAVTIISWWFSDRSIQKFLFQRIEK